MNRLLVDTLGGSFNYVNGRDGFYVSAQSDTLLPHQMMFLDFSWAYTAP